MPGSGRPSATCGCAGRRRTRVAGSWGPTGGSPHSRCSRPAAGRRPRVAEGAATPAGQANQYDAIVVGGGHNGLVAAAYLGKAGLRTVVLERRDTLGGAAGTSELAPGALVPTLAHTVGRLRPSVVRDLDLRRHGLSLVGPDVRVFAPGPDGEAIVLWGDAAR